MNFKKFISGVSALTIAASAFAGMAVTANAADPTAKQTADFENDVNPFSITAGSMHIVADDANTNPLTTGSVLYGDANRATYWNMTTKYNGKTKVSFDLKIDATGANSKGNQTTAVFALADQAAKNDNYSVKNNTDILNVSQTSTGNGQANDLIINGVSLGSAVLVNGYQRSSYSNLTNQTNRQSTGWWHYDAIIDFETEKIDLTVTRIATGETVYSNDELPFAVTTNAEAGTTAASQFGAIWFAKGGSGYGQIYVDNIVAKDAPVATISISGSDEVRAGTSSSYTASVTDQYGDAITPSKTATLALQNAVDGVTLENGVLSADASVAAGTEVVLTATADGLAAVTKTVTIAADKGYILTTTPYALVSVDGGAAINSGFDGVVDFATSDYTGANHTVVISKPGYTTRTENLTLALNETGTYKLDCSVGSYYEDFSQVNDNMNQTDVAIGNGSFYYEGGKDTQTTVTLPETVNADGSVITIAVASAHDRNGYLYLGDALGLYLRTGSIREANQSVDSARVESGYDIVKMYLPNTDDGNHRPVLYVNGIKNSATLARKDDSKKVFNSITLRNGGNTPRMTIDYILVEPLGAAADTEPTATVTIDGTSTSYFKGTTVTIPAAAEGYEWHDANDNVVAAGDIVVNADLTLTAVAVTPAGPSATVTEVSYNQYPATETKANDQDLTAAKILVTVTGSINTLGLKYNGGSAKYVQNFEGLTNANIVLGAIVPGLATLTTSSFDAVIE